MTIFSNFLQDLNTFVIKYNSIFVQIKRLYFRHFFFLKYKRMDLFRKHAITTPMQPDKQGSNLQKRGRDFVSNEPPPKHFKSNNTSGYIPCSSNLYPPTSLPPAHLLFPITPRA